MKIKKRFGMVLSGIGGGIINGLFGAGGGMVLVPLLTWLTDLEDREIFPASVSIILPICIVSLSVSARSNTVSWSTILTYLISSAIGGVLAGILGKRIPTLWLHRTLGLLILWGGIRYLC